MRRLPNGSDGTESAFKESREDQLRMEETNRTKHELLSRFGSDGSVWWEKLMKYIPPMFVTELFTLLLLSVDGIVVGNLVGDDALASVSLFYPILLLIGVISTLVASGCSTAISGSIGSNDQDKIERMKRATVVTTVISAVFLAIIQIPIMHLIIYKDMDELSDGPLYMMVQYARGLMFAIPAGLISTVGVFQLQVAGKMRLLIRLSVIEGVTNLILDLLFVGAMDMGVAGAGYGTAGACIIRCILTVYLISVKTDMFKFGRAKPGLKDYREILSCGKADAVRSLIYAVGNYFFIQILLNTFWDDAGVIRGVCFFCYSLVSVVIRGIKGGARPLIGLLGGAKDYAGMQKVLRQCMLICAVTVGTMTAFIVMFPQLFYYIHGVDPIPDGGVWSLRLFSFVFLLDGFDSLFQLYYINRQKAGFSTFLAVTYGASIIGFALVLANLLPPPCVWLTFPFTSLINLGIDIWYINLLGKEDKEKDDAELLYLSVKPEEAVEASRMLRDFASERGYPLRMVNRLSLCMEEMVSYAVNAVKNSEIRKLLRQKVPPERLVNLLPDELFDKLMELLKQSSNNETLPVFPGDVLKKLPKELQELLQQNVSVYIVIRLTMDGGRFIMMDNGRRIALNEDRESKELVTENYTLIKKLAGSVEYQYVLDMNYSVIDITP